MQFVPRMNIVKARSDAHGLRLTSTLAREDGLERPEYTDGLTHRRERHTRVCIIPPLLPPSK